MKNLWVLSALGFLLGACQQRTDCIIEGRLQGVEDGTELMLFRDYGNVSKVLMRDTVKDGKFSFAVLPVEGKLENMLLLHEKLEAGKFSSLRDIYVAPGERVKITGKNELLHTWLIDSDLPEQKIHNSLIAEVRPLIHKEREVFNNTQVLWHKLDKMDSEEERRKLADSIVHVLYPEGYMWGDSIAVKKIEVMKKMPVSEVWIKHLRELSGGMKDSKSIRYNNEKYPSYRVDLQELYQRLTTEQKESQIGKEIRLKLYPMKSVEEGDYIVDGELYDLQGNVHHLADYKGKYLLIDFWDTGCAPCRKAMPEMRRMADEWKETLTVISLSTDTKEVWKETSERENLTWVNLNDLQGRTGIYSYYGIRGIPHYIIVSPEGKILHVWEGYGKGIIERKLKEWLK